MKPTTAKKTKPTQKAAPKLAEGHVLMISVQDIFLGKNPRTEIDDEELRSLTDDIRAHGILQPIGCRQVPEGWEIVFGYRRYSAAVKAGHKEVPVRVIEANDAQALELAISENLSRSSISPADEARAVAKLRKLHSRIPLAKIASRFGRSVAWAASRVRISEMPDELLDALERGKLTLNQCEKLCRLEGSAQLDVARKLMANTLYRSLDSAIEDGLLDLSTAPWPLSFQGKCASPCTTCMCRTDMQAELFGDVKEAARCMDRLCWDQKQESFVETVKADLQYAGKSLVSQDDAWYAERKKGPYLDPTDPNGLQKIEQLKAQGVEPHYLVSNSGAVEEVYRLEAADDEEAEQDEPGRDWEAERKEKRRLGLEATADIREHIMGMPVYERSSWLLRLAVLNEYNLEDEIQRSDEDLIDEVFTGFAIWDEENIAIVREKLFPMQADASTDDDCDDADPEEGEG
jgi:ParB/RepB/Spo0J family partition protein